MDPTGCLEKTVSTTTTAADRYAWRHFRHLLGGCAQHDDGQHAQPDSMVHSTQLIHHTAWPMKNLSQAETPSKVRPSSSPCISFWWAPHLEAAKAVNDDASLRARCPALRSFTRPAVVRARALLESQSNTMALRRSHPWRSQQNHDADMSLHDGQRQHASISANGSWSCSAASRQRVPTSRRTGSSSSNKEANISNLLSRSRVFLRHKRASEGHAFRALTRLDC